MKKRKLDAAFFYESFSRLDEMMEKQLSEEEEPSVKQGKHRGTLDELLKEYMPEVERKIFEEEEKRVSLQKMPEDMEKRILAFCKKETSRKKLLRCTKAAAIFLVSILGISATVFGVKATFDLNSYNEQIGYFGVEVISNENRHLIGKEVNGEVEESPLTDKEIPYESFFSESNIANSMNHDIVHPYSVSDMKTKNGVSPEMIFDLLSCAVLYQDDYEGWYCEKGDILCYSFSKYEMENGRNQRLLLGYVYDGVMHYSEQNVFTELDGCYQVEIAEDGEYYIYLFNIDTDYLALKEGIVSVKKGN